MVVVWRVIPWKNNFLKPRRTKALSRYSELPGIVKKALIEALFGLFKVKASKREGAAKRREKAVVNFMVGFSILIQRERREGIVVLFESLC